MTVAQRTNPHFLMDGGLEKEQGEWCSGCNKRDHGSEQRLNESEL